MGIEKNYGVDVVVFVVDLDDGEDGVLCWWDDDNCEVDNDKEFGNFDWGFSHVSR